MGRHDTIDPIRQGLAEGCPPEWASRWGEDRYGLFVAFTLQGVTQSLRWIPPGRFMMGSPPDEPERSDEEGPQHEVTFRRGFWMFDTACTQGLWQAVMGGNPSHFQSPDLPVEQVSWNDVQVFLARINAQIPGLALSLPSEAQWECACRAGTTTPFSFGDNITPEQVNYKSFHPYANGFQGIYRGETVPVASLPPNPWGLFEMHGNVFEWCEDIWHDSYEEAPMDGRSWVDDVPFAHHVTDVERVVRGGSWLLGARHARGACRNLFSPDDRLHDIGFRCSRVHS